MKLSFGFGADIQEAEVTEKNLLGVLHANEIKLGLTGEAEVRRALEEPIGSPRLREIVKPGEKIAVVTSDITRPMPTVQQALDTAFEKLGPDATVLAMPYGGSTLPRIVKQ